MSFAPSPANHRHVHPRQQFPSRPLDPSRNNLAISIHELHEVNVLTQLCESRIPCASRGEGQRHVQLNHFRPERPSELNTSVCRIRININHTATTCQSRGETQ